MAKKKQPAAPVSAGLVSLGVAVLSGVLVQAQTDPGVRAFLQTIEPALTQIRDDIDLFLAVQQTAKAKRKK